MKQKRGRWKKNEAKPLPREQSENNNDANPSQLTLPATSYNPNMLGMRGLNLGVGEWTLKSLIDSYQEPNDSDSICCYWRAGRHA